MSQSATIESISTIAVVRSVDQVTVGNKVHGFVQVEYIDALARPDLSGRLSGWIRVTGNYVEGDIVAVSFTPTPSRLGSTVWAPFIR
jgi:hypothetical protein